MTKYLSWITVILWMSLIFYFSHQPATVSNELSSGITEEILDIVNKIVPALDSEMERVNHIVRKNAHFLIYLVLGVFVVNAFRTSGVQGYCRIGLALLICVLYAVSDEFHQHFIEGRGPQVKDVLIDSMGAVIGICLFCLIGWIVKRKY